MNLTRRCFSTGSSLNIAFIGLGNMGFPMMQNLANIASNSISVFDTNEKVLARAEAVGAKPFNSLRETVKNSKYVITMLPGNDQVVSAYKEISELKVTDQVWIDCSTVAPGVSTEVSELAQQVNSRFIDAPVSGGVGGAQAGSLTFMVGGKKSTFEEAKVEILTYMGKNIVHCGEKEGSGEVAKLCNNLILAISMNAVSEGLNLGTRLGVDPKVLSQIVNSSSGRCWSSDTYNPCPGVMENVPSSRNYEGGFATSLMLKDIRLALEAADTVAAHLNMGHAVENIYSRLENKGYGGKDFSVIFKELSEQT